MIKVKLSLSVPEWPWSRQTPGSRGAWGQCQFFDDPNRKECDYWVVYEGLLKEETATCPQSNTIFITGEPETFKSYDQDFVSQFATVVTPQSGMRHDNVIHSQTGLPWWVGMKLIKTPDGRHKFKEGYTLDYDKLKSMEPPPKHKLVSILTSEKAVIPGHVRRLEFVRWLEKELGSEIDVFIYSINGPEDKWDAIAPYKYHIAIENTSCPDYFTEKLSDTYLASSFPIYYGCTNLANYFPERSFAKIDIRDREGSVKLIRQLIAEDRYDQSQEALRTAKDLVLDKHNLFPLIADIISKREVTGNPTTITLAPEKPKKRRRGLMGLLGSR
ncbi:MAG: glycosyltransferase family 10 [Methanomassiliicoccales archaeon]|nr:glycosyltransferase family 10 [Methanomassiliicoccales archaeon]